MSGRKRGGTGFWWGRICAVPAGAIVLLWGLLAPPAEAQVEAPPTYGGTLWSRPRLTGNWGGVRDDLAKRGITIDADLLQTLQGVGSGGRDTGVKYGGSADFTLNADTGKLGLWPGGFFKLHLETTFANNVNALAGAVEAVNASALFPTPNHPTVTLTNLTFAQFLSTYFGVLLGKIEGYGADENEFAHGLRDKFLNLGFSFNLVNALVPISALGGGIIALPTQDPKEAIVTFFVLDPDGQPDTTGFPAFKNGVYLSAEGRVRIKPFGLIGHQLVGVNWGTKERVSLEQDPANIFRMLLFQRFPRLQDPGPILRRIIERRFPELLVPVQPLNQVQNTWAVYYNFDQYLWQPQGDPNRGVGVFFRFGASDGIANPIKYHYNAGIGGKGVVPGRPKDTFGVGWSRLQFSDNLVPFLRQRLNLGLEHEDAVELYYNFAITGWLNATVDLQVVKPGLKKFLDSANQLKDVDTAVVAGLRVYTRF